jgi:hypothetical protein
MSYYNPLILMSKQPETLRVLTLNSSSAPNGSYGLDSLGTDWTNSAGVRSGNSFYSTVPYAYLVKSKYTSRDVKIEGWWERGVAYARVSNGRGLYFYHDAASHYFEVGATLVDNTTSSPYINEISEITEKSYFVGKDMNTISGYSSSYNGTLFTMTVEGVDIICKYGDTVFLTLKDGYVWGESGSIAIKLGSGYVYDFVATHLPKKAIFSSNLANYVLDVRDFGASTFHTTGSMTGNLLTLADVTGLAPGMRLHTNLTGLPPTNGRTAGTRGTRGMDTWPQLSYVDATAMNADTSQAVGTWAWLESTGENHAWSGSSWVPQITMVAIGPEVSDINYYLSKAIPMNYRGIIVSIAGNVLTMDTSTDVAFSGTDVYFDNSYAFGRVTASPVVNRYATDVPDGTYGSRNLTLFLSNKNITLEVPAGTFAFSEGWFVTGHSNITLKGGGGRNGVTKLIAPSGGNPFQMRIFQCPNTRVEGLSWESNGRGDGYGLWWRDIDPDHASWIVPADGYQYFKKEQYGSGPYFEQSPDSFLTDCKFTDFLQMTLIFGGSSDCIADGFDIIHTTGHFKYFQWQCVADICNNVTFRNFTMQSATIIGMCEMFNGDTMLLENGTITNGRVSSNSSANVNFHNIDFIWTANSRAAWLDPSDPAINYNSNAYSYSRPGGTVEDCTFTFQGYVDAFNNLKTTIVVNAMANQDTFPDSYVGVGVKRCTLTGPDYASPATQMGPQMLISTRKNTTVEDCVCTGTLGVNSPIYGSSFGLNGPGGYIKRTIANKIAVHSSVTLGTGADANTGAITVI